MRWPTSRVARVTVVRSGPCRCSYQPRMPSPGRGAGTFRAHSKRPSSHRLRPARRVYGLQSPNETGCAGARHRTLAARSSWRAITLVVMTLGVSLEAQNPPATGGDSMPPPSFDGAPAGVRMAFERAYRDASANPRDASRAGHLAMLLHAHEQLASAGLWYDRAQRLEPDGFAWPYLAAITEAEAGDQRAAIGSFGAALAIEFTHIPARMRLAEALWRA